jgi:transposase
MNKRLSMRKIEEILRLHHACGRTNREIARAVQASPTTVADYLRRAQLAGLSWPLAEGLTDRALEAALFPPSLSSRVKRPEPDWAAVHRQVDRAGVTLDLLWQEYRETHPAGYQYSTFCERYRAFAQALPVTLRQSHAPGEQLFLDYSGQTAVVIDPTTGEERPAQIFVAVLGASNYTYVEATWTQGLADWLGAHVRCFEFLGGVPARLVPDHLKSAVTHPSRYEPDLNPSYQELASHDGTTVLPARVRKPRDKAKVEAGVLLAQRWILARLRHQRFFSLAERNDAIRPLLRDLNHRPFKKLPGSRQSVFTALDRPALKPLPLIPYEFAAWKVATVGIDYHVDVAGHYYSVPYRYARQKVDVRFTATTVEIFQDRERIASHARSSLKGRHTTVEAHLAPAHQPIAGWSAERLRHWAATIGPQTEAAITRLIQARAHPQQGYRSALGILRLAKADGAERLEAACQRAGQIESISYRSIASILKHGLERPPRTPAQAPLPLDHANVRGSKYYH